MKKLTFILLFTASTAFSQSLTIYKGSDTATYKRSAFLYNAKENKYYKLDTIYPFQSAFYADSLGNVFIYNPVRKVYIKLKTE